MNQRSNDSLKEWYNDAYAGGKNYAQSDGGRFTFSTQDITAFLIDRINPAGLKILEIGCGTGETAAAFAEKGASSVLAMDYSDQAIETCKQKHKYDNLQFQVGSWSDVDDRFDLIIMQEVIEHLDEPEQSIIALMNLLGDGGRLVVTCPNFSNIRGAIWMTLQLLFDVPMSLSDLHFFTPGDMEQIARKNGLNVSWSTFAHDRIVGEKLKMDMEKRLTNALRDAGMDNSKVNKLVEWMTSVSLLEAPLEHNGGKGLYIFTR